MICLLLKGTLKQFQMLTGWKGEKVVYFGDHAYTDLADVTLHHGWRTGAIIKELEVSKFSIPIIFFCLQWASENLIRSNFLA